MTAKSIVWVHPFGPSLASYRYRAAVPCEEVGKINGYTTAINDGDADIVIFSKPTIEQYEMAKKAKAEGAKVIVDFSDDHFNHPTVGPVYRDFAKLADGITCATPIMQGRIYDYLHLNAQAIPDPYEQPEQEPHADGDVYIWFGHILNIEELNRVAVQMQGRKLIIATGPNAPNNQQVIWGPEALGKALAASNIAILPTRAGRDNNSNNRLLNAIRAGVFPICMEHPANREFRDMVWVGHFQTGLKWASAFKGELNSLVAEAQDYIRDRYSPRAIGCKWADYLESV